MSDYGYGLWPLVIFNTVLMVAFAASFFRPRTKADWGAFGGFSAFIVSLFTEMYGFPLTVYLLGGPLAGLVPGVNFTHSGGHLWNDLIGWKGDAMLSPFHLASYVLIIAGFWLIYAGWWVLYAAHKTGELATAGPYAHIRHPQYLGFIVIMAGFLLQWPTFVTLALFPVLVVVYRRLAAREERSVRAEFAEAYDAWAAATPRFVPHLRALRFRVRPEWTVASRVLVGGAQRLARRLGSSSPAPGPTSQFSGPRPGAGRLAPPPEGLFIRSSHEQLQARGRERKEAMMLLSSVRNNPRGQGDGAAREVRVRVRGGYDPAVIRAEAGVPLRVLFRREEAAACSEQVVFPALGKSATLPQGEEVAVELLPKLPGEYEFTCGMGMLHGRLVVSSRRSRPVEEVAAKAPEQAPVEWWLGERQAGRPRVVA